MLTTPVQEKKQSSALDEMIKNTLYENDEDENESADNNEHLLNSEKRKKKRRSSYELSEMGIKWLQMDTVNYIQWHVILLLLEGQLVHLPAPKSHYAKDIAFTCDTPIFATGNNPIFFVKNGMLNEERKRKRDDEFAVENISFPREKKKELRPYGKCFATLTLDQNGDEYLLKSR